MNPRTRPGWVVFFGGSVILILAWLGYAAASGLRPSRAATVAAVATLAAALVTLLVLAAVLAAADRRDAARARWEETHPGARWEDWGPR